MEENPKKESVVSVVRTVPELCKAQAGWELNDKGIRMALALAASLEEAMKQERESGPAGEDMETSDDKDDTDRVTEWNKTLTEAKVLKSINTEVAITYQVGRERRE